MAARYAGNQMDTSEQTVLHRLLKARATSASQVLCWPSGTSKSCFARIPSHFCRTFFAKFAPVHKLRRHTAVEL